MMEYIPVIVLVMSFVLLLAIGTPVAWSIAISSLLTSRFLCSPDN
jgi:hypothetical protein